MNATVDVKALKARAEKARDMTITVKCGWKFHLRRPADMFLRDMLMDPAAQSAPAAYTAKNVYAGLRGWDGPTVGDVVDESDKDAAAAPLPFDKELFDPLFSDRPELVDELGAALLKGFIDRLNVRREAEKNLQSSSGSVPS